MIGVSPEPVLVATSAIGAPSAGCSGVTVNDAVNGCCADAAGAMTKVAATVLRSSRRRVEFMARMLLARRSHYIGVHPETWTKFRGRFTAPVGKFVSPGCSSTV